MVTEAFDNESNAIINSCRKENAPEVGNGMCYTTGNV